MPFSFTGPADHSHVQISPDVVNNLSARLASEETMPERQFAIDSHIRERIQRELTALRAEEETVQLEIHRALEKENLDREMSMVEDGSAHGGLKTGVALIGDLEEIREKVDRFQTRRQLGDFPSVKETGEAIASCYKYVSYSFHWIVFQTKTCRMNLTTPLECWREVARFKAAVADAETVRESLELLTSEFDTLCSDTSPRCGDTGGVLILYIMNDT